LYSWENGGSEGSWSFSASAGLSPEWSSRATSGNYAAKFTRNYITPAGPFTYTGPLSFSTSGVSNVKFDFTIADSNNGLAALRVELLSATQTYTTPTLTSIVVGSAQTVTISNLPSGVTLTGIRVVLTPLINSWGEFWVDSVRRC